MSTSSVTFGRSPDMSITPPGTLKSMMSAPALPFASLIASLSVPGLPVPSSVALVTV